MHITWLRMALLYEDALGPLSLSRHRPINYLSPIRVEVGKCSRGGEQYKKKKIHNLSEHTPAPSPPLHSLVFHTSHNEAQTPATPEYSIAQALKFRGA
jgi:hypothetical protein